MSIPCSENTVLINTTHKILSDLQTTNPNIVATMPTSNAENVLGFDTVFRSWKLFLCQYKRPYYENGEFTYYLNMDQTLILAFWSMIFGSLCAFYPLVLASSDQHLTSINLQLLDNVLFVDVRRISPFSTMIWVDTKPKGGIQIECKIWRGPWIPVRGYYRWQHLRQQVEECKAGGFMKRDGEVTESNKLLRDAIVSLSDNELPSWLRARVQKWFVERSDKQAEVFLDFAENLLARNREMERPTHIASPSLRAFICPTK
jgi:hypothetical protein